MATIFDVARRAGVSTATVSRVLNGVGSVNEETRARVVQVVAELGFSPNALARALHSKRTRTVALLVPDISNPYYPQIARGVEDAASEHGYSVVICNTYARPEKLRESIRVLREKRVDGLILGGGATEDGGLPEFDPHTWPAVVGVGYPSADFPAVGIDNRQAAYEATAHLLALGHRRIGFIAGPLARRSVRERVAGYERCLVDHGVRPDPALILEGDFQPASGQAAARRWLGLDAPPTAIFAASDRMAIGAMEALTDAGRRVPDDVAVVGFDDTPICPYVRPALTTVSVPAYDLGATAMRQVLRLLAQEPTEDLVLLPTRLVIRESSVGRRRGSPSLQATAGLTAGERLPD